MKSLQDYMMRTNTAQAPILALTEVTVRNIECHLKRESKLRSIVFLIKIAENTPIDTVILAQIIKDK